MLRILSGVYPLEGKRPIWIRGKVMSSFDRRVKPDWLADTIVKDELRDVDRIVNMEGLLLEKDSGIQIPVNWISQGSKQFITATQNPSIVVNCFYVGWNVYKYFYKWCKEKDVDITLLMNTSFILNVEQNLSGVFLNTGEYFSSNIEVAKLIHEHKKTKLDFNTLKDFNDWCDSRKR